MPDYFTLEELTKKPEKKADSSFNVQDIAKEYGIDMSKITGSFENPVFPNNPEKRAEQIKTEQDTRNSMQFGGPIEQKSVEYPKKVQQIRSGLTDVLNQGSPYVESPEGRGQRVTDYLKESGAYTNEKKAGLAGQTLENAPGMVNYFTPEELIPKKPEEEKAGFGKALGSGFLKGSAELGEGVGRLPATIYRLAAAPQNLVADITGWDNLKSAPPEWLQNNPLAEYYENQAEQWSKNTKDYEKSIGEQLKKGDIGGALKSVGVQVAQTLPLTMSLMAGGASGAGAVTGIGIGGYATGMKLKQLDEQMPDMQEWMKVYNSVLTGAGEALSESMGSINIGKMGRDLLEKAGAAKLKQVAKDSFVKTVGEKMKNYALNSAMIEGLEEAGAQFSENLVDRATGVDPERNLMEGVFDATVVGFAAGGITTGPIHVSGKVLEKVNDRKNLEKINQFYSGIAPELANKETGDIVEAVIPGKEDQGTFYILGSIDDVSVAVATPAGDVVHMAKDRLHVTSSQSAEEWQSQKIQQATEEYKGQRQQENFQKAAEEVAAEEATGYRKDDIVEFKGEQYTVSEVSPEGITILKENEDGLPIMKSVAPNQIKPWQEPVVEPEGPKSVNLGGRDFQYEESEDGMFFPVEKKDAKFIADNTDTENYEIEEITEEVPIENAPEFAKKKTETIFKGVRIKKKQNEKQKENLQEEQQEEIDPLTVPRQMISEVGSLEEFKNSISDVEWKEVEKAYNPGGGLTEQQTFEAMVDDVMGDKGVPVSEKKQKPKEVKKEQPFEEVKAGSIKMPEPYGRAMDKYKMTSLGDKSENNKNKLIEEAQTEEGKAYVKSYVGTIPTNEDGTITVYRIGSVREGNNSPVTLDKDFAERVMYPERRKQGLSDKIHEIKVKPEDIIAVVPGIESEVIVNFNSDHVEQSKKTESKEKITKEDLNAREEEGSEKKPPKPGVKQGQKPESKQSEKKEKKQDKEIAKSKKEIARLKKLREDTIKSAGDQKEMEVEQPEQPVEKIEDFGEKIGGARKDKYKQYTDDLSNLTEDDILSKPLSKTFPEPDYKSLVEDGIITKEEAAFIKYYRSNIGRKPSKSYRQQRWKNQVETAAWLTEGIISGKKVDGKSIYDLVMSGVGVNGKEGVSKTSIDAIKHYIDLIIGVGFPQTNVNLGDYKLKYFANIYKKGKYEDKPAWTIVKGHTIVGDFETKPEAIAALKYILENKEPTDRKTKLDIWSMRDEPGKYYVGKKVGAGKYITLNEGKPFDTVREANSFIKESYDKLIEELESKKIIPEERPEQPDERIGIDWRNGKNITPDEFNAAFGFRGVEFGNWVENQKRQDDLNNAYDALMDLADIIGVPSQAISLGGELGLAFGARGKGGKKAASAHYETDKVAINLTKVWGAGSLAHEWWHAVDNYFSRMRGQKNDFLTEKPWQKLNKDGKTDESVRIEMVNAFKAVSDAIRKSGMPKRSRGLDERRTKDYWSQMLEMSARSFESYIKSELNNRDQRNDYLVSFKDIVDYIVQSGADENVYPYPTKEEQANINQAFKNFFKEAKIKEEGNKKIMFRRGEMGNGDSFRNKIIDRLIFIDTLFALEGFTLDMDSNNNIYAFDKEGKMIENLPDDLYRLAEEYADLAFAKNVFHLRKRMGGDLGLYSNTAHALNQITQDKATPEQWKAMLLKNGSKEAELDWIKWNDFVQDKKSITKDEIRQFVKDNMVQLEEVRKGEMTQEDYYDQYALKITGKRYSELNREEQLAIEEEYESDMENAGRTMYMPSKAKFQQWSTPGGKRYKELLLTLPVRLTRPSVDWQDFITNEKKLTGDKYRALSQEDKNSLKEEYASKYGSSPTGLDYQKATFKSTHYEEPNIVVHTRISDFTTKDGKKALHIDEIQSDWAQEGRKKGFKGKENEDELTNKIAELNNKIAAAKDTDEIKQLELERMQVDIQRRNLRQGNVVPNTPFKKTDQWVKLAVRRILVYAAENGYDQVTWTTGEKQADRYDLSKQVDAINYSKSIDEGMYNVAITKDGYTIDSKTLDEKGLEEYVGKEITKKIVDGESTKEYSTGLKEISGLDLKVGGEGQIEFYDNIVRKNIAKEVKRFGIQPGQSQINTTPEIQDGTNQVTGETDQEAEFETVHSIYLNDELRRSVLEGMPMFRIIGEGKAEPSNLAGNILSEPTTRAKTTQVTQIWNSLLSQTDASIKVVKTHEDLPAWVKAQLQGEKPKGVHVGNMSYLVTSAQDNVADAIRTFIHEVGVHEGITRIIPDSKQRIKFLEKVVDDIGMEAIEKVASPEDIEAFKRGEMTKDMLGNEYIAYLAEKKLSGKDLIKQEQTIWERFLDFINKQISKLLNRNVKITENDVLQIARASLQSVFQERSVTPGPGRAVSGVQESVRDGGKDTKEPVESGVRFAGDVLNNRKSRKLSEKNPMSSSIIINEETFERRFDQKTPKELIEKQKELRKKGYTLEAHSSTTDGLIDDFINSGGIEGGISASTLGSFRYYDKGWRAVYLAVSGKPIKYAWGDIGNGMMSPKNTPYDEIYLIGANLEALIIPNYLDVFDYWRVLINSVVANELAGGNVKIVSDKKSLDKDIEKVNKTIDDYIKFYKYNKHEYKNWIYDGIPTELRDNLLPDEIKKMKNETEFPLPDNYFKNWSDESFSLVSGLDYQYLKNAVEKEKERRNNIARKEQLAGDLLEQPVQRRGITQTKAFKDWFGDSKVVDENGKPLVVYHGTIEDFNDFETDGNLKKTASSGYGIIEYLGSSFSDSPIVADSYITFKPDTERAGEYISDDGNKRLVPKGASIMPVYLSIKNPKTYRSPERMMLEVREKYSSDNQNAVEWSKDVSKQFKEDLIKQGYDGIKFKEGVRWNPRKKEFLSDVYIAFSPAQIKSATGNQGTFDPDNPNILMRRGKKEEGFREKYTEQTEEREKILNKDIYKILADRDVAVEKFQSQVKKLGGKVIPESDIALALNLYNSRKLEKQETFDRELRDPLFDTLRKLKRDANVSFDDIYIYMRAKHAPERNRVLYEREIERINKKYDYEIENLETLNKKKEKKKTVDGLNKERNEKLKELADKHKKDDNLSGFTTDKAEIIIEEFEGKLKDKKLLDLFWSQIKAMNHYALNQQYEGDVISKELYDKLLDQYEYYVPLKGWDREGEPDFDYVQDMGQIFSSPIKTAEGRKTLSDSPLPYVINAAYSAIIQNEKNHIAKTAARLISDNQELFDKHKLGGHRRVWVVEDGFDGTGQLLEREETVKPDQSLFDQGKVRTRRNAPLPYQIRRSKYESAQNEVEVYFNGDKHILWFHKDDPAVANAIKRKLPKTIEQWTAGMNASVGKITRFMAGNFTMRSPNFIIGNIFRDLPLSAVSNYIDNGMKGGLKFLGATIKIQPTLKRGLQDKLDPNNKIDKYFIEFKQGGGRTGFSYLQDVKAIEKKIKKQMKRREMVDNMGVVRYPVNILPGLINGIEKLATWSEDISRFATYVAERELGKTHLEAIKASKNVSVNFDKKGELSGILGGVYAFFNANVRAVVKYGQMWQKAPYKMGGIHVYLMLQGFLMAKLFDQFGGFDDDDEEVKMYDTIGDYKKYNYFNIPIIDISIPMPHILRLPHAMGVSAYEWWSGRQTGEEALVKMLKMAPGEFSPVNPVDMFAENGLRASPMSPTAVRPLFELSENMNFMGTPIYKEMFTPDLEAFKADASKHFKRVGPLFKDVTWAMYQLGGGNEQGDKFVEKDGKIKEVPDVLDWNPEKIEHLYQSYLGGIGKLFNQSSKMVEMTLDATKQYLNDGELRKSIKENFDSNSMPVIYQFKINPWVSPLNEFWYDELETMKIYENVLRSETKQSDTEGVKRLLDDKSTYIRYEIFKGYKEQSDLIWDYMKGLPESDPKFKELDEIQKQLKKQYREAVKDL